MQIRDEDDVSDDTKLNHADAGAMMEQVQSTSGHIWMNILLCCIAYVSNILFGLT